MRTTMNILTKNFICVCWLDFRFIKGNHKYRKIYQYLDEILNTFVVNLLLIFIFNRLSILK